MGKAPCHRYPFEPRSSIQAGSLDPLARAADFEILMKLSHAQACQVIAYLRRSCRDAHYPLALSDFNRMASQWAPGDRPRGCCSPVAALVRVTFLLGRREQQLIWREVVKLRESPSEITMSPSGTYQQVLDQDTTHEIPAALRYQNTVDLGTDPISVSRYISAEFFRKEREKVWLKTWQYAVREEEIPNPGDTYIFDLLDKSLLITRQADGSIKAMQNVCMHRGRKLATQGGCKERFRCPYHGFTWNTDGSFRENPFEWDFPQIDNEKFRLREARVETWAGFVFVNFDQSAQPLHSLLGDMPKHFEYWRLQDCYKSAHIAKIVPANWKVCSEAFFEGHHLFTTHPQTMPYTAPDRAQYDVISDHVTRMLAPAASSGYLWDGPELTEEGKVKAMLAVGSRANMPGQQQSEILLSEGQTTRNYMADLGRKALQAETGYDFSHACDADILDGISYDIFPSFHVWGAFPLKLAYRFRPYGMDHEKTIWEVMILRIIPKDQPRPKPAQMRLLGEDESWSSVVNEIGYFSGLFDQDTSNMAPTQQGLRDLGPDGVIHASRYQEMRMRHMHHMIDVYMQR